MRVQLANSSFFPEVDFASKCITASTGEDLAATLSRLSSASSGVMRKKLGGKTLYMGSEMNEEGDRVVLQFHSPEEQLLKGKRYL
jgi:hypothetical protein